MTCETQVGPSPVFWPGSPETVRIPAAVGRHPKVPAGWNIAARAIGHPKVLLGRLGCGVRGSGWGAVSGDQAEFPGPGDGFGPVGGAELAQDVGHVFFDRVERYHQVVGDALV